MKYYAAVIAFTILAAWLSCVSLVKTQTSSLLSLDADALEPPTYTLPDTIAYQPPPECAVKTDSCVVIANNTVKKQFPKDLHECRSMVDTMTLLNQTTFRIMDKTSDLFH